MIGRRLGFGSEPMPPHNLTFTTLGFAMLWVGCIRFNAGANSPADGLTSSAFRDHPLFGGSGSTGLGDYGVGIAQQAERTGGLLGEVGGIRLHHA